MNVHLPWFIKPSGLVHDSAHRAIAQFWDPEQGSAGIELLNRAATTPPPTSPEPDLAQRPPRGLYPALLAWVEAKEAKGGNIRECEKALLAVASTWISSD